MLTAAEELDHYIDKFTPEIAILAKAAIAHIHKQIPSAIRLVYDNYNALAVGFGPTVRASDAIISIALYPKRINLCFLQGGKSGLKDPHHLLQGSGNTNRFIPLASAGELETPAVQDLISQALASAKVPLVHSGVGALIIKSVSAKQRPRRPT